ncbi:MAG: dCTP deaminase [Candidatus Pacebacteria bacterium]|jgi:dCTP deaminase|nr:dCTP deaminase [Candidatus Paceibacterota bacterium]
MSILTKKQILEKINAGEILFEPNLDEFQIQAHAIDLRLGYTFLLPKRWQLTEKGRVALNIDHLSEDRPDYFDIIELEKSQTFDLLPGEYVLASTLETVGIPDDLMAILYPRSSTNRKGLSVDLTGIVDSGYKGQLAIPIRNNTESQVIKLYPGERFCQVVFEKLDEKAEIKESRYHQKDIIEGFIKQNFKNAEKDRTESDLVREGKIPELKRDHKA